MPDVYTAISWAVAAVTLVAGSQLLSVAGLLALPASDRGRLRDRNAA
jgi:hypothetical protein